MSTILRNPRTFQNRNRTVTRAQELMQSSHRSQQKELEMQQRLILMQQAKQILEKRSIRSQNHKTENDDDDLDEKYEKSTNGMNGHNAEDDFVMVAEQDETPNVTLPTNNRNTRATIFVSVASYRDPECAATVLDLFSKAQHPDRVFVGVYEQNDPETDKEFTIAHLLEDTTRESPLVAYYKNGQLRPMITSCVEAKGPMYARALIEQNLFQNEDFYMIIDSHALFEPNWDTTCIAEWAKANKLSQKQKTKAVLSYFPPNFDRTRRSKTPLQLDPSLKLDYLRFLEFNKNCGFPMPTKQPYKNMPREPIRALFWTACFSFAAGSMIHDVPFDDGYPYLFLGEEICMNLRLFTHGYDIYGPSKHILYHIEDRDYRPTFWELFYVNHVPRNPSFTVTDEDRDLRKKQCGASVARMSQLLYNHPEHGIDSRYGLGQERSYKEFCDFIGINFEKQVTKEHVRFGRTPQPSKEEQYAKTVENKSMMPKTKLMPINMNKFNNTTKQQKMPPPRTPQRMTPMTGLTGGGIKTTPTKPKEIPRTRVPRQQQNGGGRATGPNGPPKAREYARGMWGKP